jgi:hypothetical protein
LGKKIDKEKEMQERLRELIFKLLEKWLEIILAFKRGQLDKGSRDLISRKEIDKTINEILQLFRDEVKGMKKDKLD